MSKQAAQTGECETVRIMSSNIWGNCGDHAIANRDDNLASLFVRYKPGVLGLQEVSPKVRREPVHLFSLLEAHYAEVAVDIGALSNNYTPLLYLKHRFTVLDSGFHRFSGLNDSNSKSVTWAVFACSRSGRKFAVCNVHYYWKNDAAGHEARVGNSRELLRKVGEIVQQWRVPVWCIGDFNCRADSEPIRLLLEQGFTDAWHAAECASDSNAHHPYPVWDAAKQTFGNGPAPSSPYTDAIDHILYSGGTPTVRTYETVTCREALDASDHCPIYVDVSI